MRKGIAERGSTPRPLTKEALAKIEKEGYKYVQIKGLTFDKHYEYVEPHYLVLVPMKELPTDPAQKDIYEPIASKILQQWATEKNDVLEILIAASN